MIGEYTLEILCDKYNVSAEKLVNKNNNILTYGEYRDINNTLDYLINKLSIDAKNIEKCPSILYRNVDEISRNIDFLRKQKISFSSIENCLHVLSSDSNNLIETYNYIEENYGVSSINKNTSALSCSKEIIIEIEKLKLNKSWNLAIASAVGFGSTTLEDIQKIIQSKEFQAHPELFTSQTLAHAKLEDISKLLNMPYWDDIKFKHLLTSSVVAKSKQMINKLPILFNMAEQYQIDGYLNTSFLLFSPSQNFALISYLKENNLPLILDGKLNQIFGKQPVVLKTKYGIDMKELIDKYPYEENNTRRFKK